VRFLGNDFTFSKRLLGWLMVLVGLGGFAGLLVLNILRQKPVAEIGPAQQLVFALCTLIALIGASLIPLGNSPA
jgi:predicted MFS family arabinose efflux permease